MPTACSPALFEFAPVEGRAVVASFDGGRITSDAGALLLGAADCVIGLTRRMAACFADARDPDLIEHDVQTLVMQRVVGIAPGYNTNGRWHTPCCDEPPPDLSARPGAGEDPCAASRSKGRPALQIGA